MAVQSLLVLLLALLVFFISIFFLRGKKCSVKNMKNSADCDDRVELYPKLTRKFEQIQDKSKVLVRPVRVFGLVLEHTYHLNCTYEVWEV